MVEGVLNLSGTVFSASWVTLLESRIATRTVARFIATRAMGALARSAAGDWVPYVGWAIAIGSVAYAGYEAYNELAINWSKLENETYDEDDLAVFRMGFTAARQRFIATEKGAEAERSRQKYILIPSEVMPTVAAIDAVGIGQYGNILTWDPAGAAARRRQAITKLGAAGMVSMSDGTRLRGSWEEYPFAVTLAPRPGSWVDRAPLRENWIQGGFIRAAAIVQDFHPNDILLCYIL